MRSMDLWEFCKEYPLEEKIFIVPTRTIGLQMINKMTREGHSSLNLKPITLKRLAFEICEEYIEREKKLIVDDILGNSLIIQILKDLNERDPENFFFKKDLIDTRTAEEVYRVIMELKHSDLEDFPREKDLDRIFGEYKAALKVLNAMDYQDIILKATELDRLEEYKKKKIALAYNIEFENVEQRLLEKLIEKNSTRINMPVRSLSGKPKNYYFKEASEGDMVEGKTIDFYGEYGSKNEIQYIIRDIMDKRIALDEVVIAYTNSKYADLINIEFEGEDLPIGFGQGLGIESSSAYRFIETIFNWAENYFSIKEIRPIFLNGDIRIDLKDGLSKGSISPSSMYEELVLSRVIFGRDNYKKLLKLDKDNWQKGHENKTNSYSLARRIWLSEFFGDVFHALPDEEGICMGDYIPRLVNLIDKYVRNLNKYDGAAKTVVLETLSLMENIDIELGPSEYFNLVLSYIRKNKILRSQPQPGQVFATTFKNAAYTGRKNLYLIGLDSDSLSNKVMESPILLDNMRRQISDRLSFANESYRYKKYKIRELLTGDFENISIGYSNFDTVDVKEKSPSQIYTELKEIYDHREKDDRVKEWGLLGRDLVKSGTALETLADCSRKAYLRYKMGLRPMEDVDIRVDRWLDGLSRGNLVHNILNHYFDLDRDKQSEEALRTLVEEESDKILEEVPYALGEVFLREREEVLGICQDIINREKEDSGWEVLVNELSFGDIEKKNNGIFGVLDKQRIDVAGHILEISGAIDRVDVNKKDSNLLRIVDYKTGNKNNFEKKLGEKIGRGSSGVLDLTKTKKFQYYIYKKVLEKILGTRKDLYPQGRIDNFVYVFQGRGDKATIDIEFTEDTLSTVENRIRELLDMDILEEDKKIVYDPEDKLRCKYCDYKSICMVDKDINAEEGEVAQYE